MAEIKSLSLDETIVSERILSANLDDCLEIAKALASELRLAILKKLNKRSLSINELSETLELPASTVALNVKKLEDAGLLRCEIISGTRGNQKICAAVTSRVVINTQDEDFYKPDSTVFIPMPIGHFYEANVSPTCGILSDSSFIGEIDDPGAFFEPERVNAGLIWFRNGYLEYRFPDKSPRGCKIKNLEISMEICSEAPLYNPDWPSDITLWINGVEVGTWISPGDFGGQKGLLTPNWWGTQNTQYGLMKVWRVSAEGSYIDGTKISDISIEDLSLEKFRTGGSSFISVRIGVKPDAVNNGGINIFGKTFGNYDSDIVMRLDFIK